MLTGGWLVVPVLTDWLAGATELGGLVGTELLSTELPGVELAGGAELAGDAERCDEPQPVSAIASSAVPAIASRACIRTAPLATGPGSAASYRPSPAQLNQPGGYGNR
jgi:hypothetical protein